MKYILMHKNIPVVMLELEEDTGNIIKIGEIYHKQHLPVGVHVKQGIVDGYDLKIWWNDRSIPASRSGVNKALETLKLQDTKMLLTKCFGLSLSDQYWIRPAEREDITWEDINFFENHFSEDIGDILLGKAIKNNGCHALCTNLMFNKNIDFHSPDNTSDGCLKKRWKIMNGKRCLIKGGSNPYIQQPFNEAVATVIAEALQIPHVPYWIMWDEGNPYSVCEDFITAQTELVSAWRVMQMQKKSNSTSVYRHYLNCCEALGIADAEFRIEQMIVLDYIIANEDRHQNNFGLIRNADTLEWIGIAPIYDSGSSLGYDKVPKQIASSKNIECKPFKTNHDKQIQLVTSFDWIDFSALEGIGDKIKSIFDEAIEKSDTIDENRVAVIISSVNKRIGNLKALALQKQKVIDKLEEDVVRDIAETYISD